MDIESLAEFVNWRPPETRHIIEHGILLPESRLVIFGKYKAWKSMIAMHTALCISAGIPWFGFKTTQQNVLLIQMEISKTAFWNRIIKYITNHSTNANQYKIHLASNPYGLKIDGSYGMNDLDKAITKSEAQLVVIDPLYQTVQGDINDSFSMTKLVDNLNFMILKHKISIILVHHERKSTVNAAGRIVERGAEDMTGTMYIPNWTDGAVKLTLLKDQPHAELQLRFTAMRNAWEMLDTKYIRCNRSNLNFTEIDKPLYIKQIQGLQDDDDPDLA